MLIWRGAWNVSDDVIVYVNLHPVRIYYVACIKCEYPFREICLSYSCLSLFFLHLSLYQFLFNWELVNYYGMHWPVWLPVSIIIVKMCWIFLLRETCRSCRLKTMRMLKQLVQQLVIFTVPSVAVQVHPTSIQRILQAEAYILFYIRSQPMLSQSTSNLQVS